MPTQSENTKRIAKNTLMLYVRMLFSMVVSLYTSRVVLNTLGVEDYGIYNVVGGFVAMFSLVSSSLSASVGRFLTFELGRGDMDRLKRVFITSISIHVVLIAVVLVLTETVGVWFLNHRLTIPSDRLYAANWVFQASVFSFILGLFSVPYNASIISHERMKAFAYIGILDVILRLFIVLFVAYSPWQFDRLIVYALLLVAVSMSLQLVYLCYCRRNFEECRFRLHFDKKYWKDMSAFAGWNFIGASSALLKDQGVNIILNLFIGPVVNAARGISLSVNAAVTSFAGNFMVALNPQITKSYVTGDRAYMISLVERGSRFSFYIILLFAMPILFETDFILTLWLKQYPEHTINFVRLVLILSLCDVLSNTLVTLQLANGNIRTYQLVVGGMQMMNFPLSYICLKQGCQPESTWIIAILISTLNLLLRLAFLRKMVGLPMKQFIKNVCGNVLYVTCLSLALPLAFFINMQDGLMRFIFVVVISLVSVSIVVYKIGCSTTERLFIRNRVKNVIKKLV